MYFSKLSNVFVFVAGRDEVAGATAELDQPHDLNPLVTARVVPPAT